MTKNQVKDRVIELVARHALCQPGQLSSDTRIGEDLRIVGDDADDFLTEFSSEFNIDLSNMDFGSYFPDEASASMHYYLTTITKSKYRNPFVLAVRRLESNFWRLFAKNKTFETLTVGDLVLVANNEKSLVSGT